MSVLHWHSESGSLWYADSFNPGDGLVEDVTGIEWAEKLAKEKGLMTDQKQMRADPVAKISDDLAHYLWGKGYGRNCCNCDLWNKPDQKCNKFQVLPPAEVVIVGCKHHTDLIPF